MSGSANKGGFWALLSGHPAVRFGVVPSDIAMRAHGQVYLATPYSKPAAPGGVFSMAAAEAVAEQAAWRLRALALLGVSAVSPIVLAQAMVRDIAAFRGPAVAAGFALDAGFWTRWCAPLLEASASIYVPDIDGWRESEGIRHEVADFVARPRPVYVAGWP